MSPEQEMLKKLKKLIKLIKSVIANCVKSKTKNNDVIVGSQTQKSPLNNKMNLMECIETQCSF